MQDSLKLKYFASFLLVIASGSLPVCAQTLVNPGFEDGTMGWELKDAMSAIVPEAAHTGSKGLRVTDDDGTAGSSATSDAVPVQAGQMVKLSFWARTESRPFIGVYLIFRNGAGKWISEDHLKLSGGLNMKSVDLTDGQWQPYTLEAPAPPDASDVRIWVHSWGNATGTADFDDFELSIRGGTDTASPRVPPASVARKAPPSIIIKADDLRPIDGRVNRLWQKFADFIESRNLKASIGVLMDKMPEATPDFIQWIKDKQASGNFEFWFHGWDHATHEVDGVKLNEFNKRPFEEQKRRFDKSQKFALEHFGFPFATFGPPGGASNGFFDENTIRVMAEEPHMKVWLYPQPLDGPGRELETANKVTILDRVWAVNFESKVGQPDFQRFLDGYAKNPDRAYFVLQGHPMHWGSAERFAEFTKIIDFLIEQNADFVTPSEYAKSKTRSVP